MEVATETPNCLWPEQQRQWPRSAGPTRGCWGGSAEDSYAPDIGCPAAAAAQKYKHQAPLQALIWGLLLKAYFEVNLVLSSASNNFVNDLTSFNKETPFLLKLDRVDSVVYTKN